MSDSGVFRTQADEVRLLLAQLEEIRKELQSIAHKLASIEKHVARAFPKEYAQHRERRRSTGPKRDESPELLGPDGARKMFDRLSALWREGQSEQVKQELAAASTDRLREIAAVGGISHDKRVTRSTLRALIVQKVTESAMLRSNITLEERRADIKSEPLGREP
jgi:hypothetical protein